MTNDSSPADYLFVPASWRQRWICAAPAATIFFLVMLNVSKPQALSLRLALVVLVFGSLWFWMARMQLRVSQEGFFTSWLLPRRRFRWNEVNSIEQVSWKAGFSTVPGFRVVLSGDRTELLRLEGKQLEGAEFACAGCRTVSLESAFRECWGQPIMNAGMVDGPGGEDIGPLATRVSVAALVLFVLSLVLLATSTGHMVAEPQVGGLLLEAGVLAATFSAWIQRKTRKLVILVTSLLFAGTSVLFFWALLFQVTVFSGQPESVMFEVSVEHHSQSWRSVAHVPAYSFGLGGMPRDWTYPAGSRVPLVIRTGPLGLATLSGSQFDMLWGSHSDGRPDVVALPKGAH